MYFSHKFHVFVYIERDFCIFHPDFDCVFFMIGMFELEIIIMLIMSVLNIFLLLVPKKYLFKI